MLSTSASPFHLAELISVSIKIQPPVRTSSPLESQILLSIFMSVTPVAPWGYGIVGCLPLVTEFIPDGGCVTVPFLRLHSIPLDARSILSSSCLFHTSVKAIRKHFEMRMELSKNKVTCVPFGSQSL